MTPSAGPGSIGTDKMARRPDLAEGPSFPASNLREPCGQPASPGRDLRLGHTDGHPLRPDTPGQGEGRREEVGRGPGEEGGLERPVQDPLRQPGPIVPRAEPGLPERRAGRRQHHGSLRGDPFLPGPSCAQPRDRGRRDRQRAAVRRPPRRAPPGSMLRSSTAPRPTSSS